MNASTLWRLEVDGETVEEVTGFNYSSDIMAVGEECRWSVVNPLQKYVGKLLPGSLATVYAINRDVNGGAPTLKFRGRIVERNAEVSAAGSLIDLGIYDLGWHLQNCCAPLWFRLDHARFVDLIDPAKVVIKKGGAKGYFIEPAFGFTGFRTDGLKRAQAKLGAAAVLQQQQQVVGQLFYVQVEPGDKIYDRIVEYARRENRLINVSPTGEIQTFLPNYAQKELYEFRLESADSSANNIERAKEIQNCSTRYTKVEVVGQQLQYEGPQDPNNPNATKKRGCVNHPEILPFPNRLTLSDGEMYQRGLAQKMANWHYMRGKYDAYALQLDVVGHHQNGIWYESDTMANVSIDELGIKGRMYVSAVRYGIDADKGDVATLTLRLPDLLTASFGVYPQPPLVKSLKDPGRPTEEGKQ